MCGIAGMVRFAGLSPDERNIGAVMAATLRHRGPDDTGHYADTCATLGHTRLSIIDLDAGRQPMSNEDGTIWVTFNGEVYNHRQIAEQLRSRGHVLRTRCDTEVLVHLYEDHGDKFVEHLNGMFAIAIWDSRQRKLLLVRDRLGIKPLYWHDDGTRVVFGSELKAILAAGDIDPRIDPCALTDYLTFGQVPAPRTIFQGIRKLEPGYLASCTAKGVALRQYWDIPIRNPQFAIRNSSEWIEEFAALLQDSVSLRMIADVPVGAFLSGGVDSATVVAACRFATKGKDHGNILTHTVGFNEQDHDERTSAREVAELLSTDHHEVMVHADAAWASEHLIHHFDEPFADSSAIPTFYLSQATRQRVTVALAGDGGDEMLGGYRRYRFDLAENAIRENTPAWMRSTAGLAGALYPKADWLPRPLRAKRTLQNLACDDVTAHLRSVAIRAGTLPGFLIRPEVEQSDYDPFTRSRELFARYPSPELLDRLLFLDMKTLMADDILTKVDRTSMAVGLEVREPLLDYRIVELAAQMPISLKQNKNVLRQVLARWTNPTIANRRKKGFDIPMDAWFRGPLRDMANDVLAAPDAQCAEWLHGKNVRQLIDQHQRGFRNNGHVLWTLLSLELWAQAYVNRARIDRTPQLEFVQ